jgi:hypothetical protein
MALNLQVLGYVVLTFFPHCLYCNITVEMYLMSIEISYLDGEAGSPSGNKQPGTRSNLAPGSEQAQIKFY